MGFAFKKKQHHSLATDGTSSPKVTDFASFTLAYGRLLSALADDPELLLQGQAELEMLLAEFGFDAGGTGVAVVCVPDTSTPDLVSRSWLGWMAVGARELYVSVSSSIPTREIEDLDSIIGGVGPIWSTWNLDRSDAANWRLS